jgi:hypothetical protein
MRRCLTGGGEIADRKPLRRAAMPSREKTRVPAIITPAPISESRFV